ncbi:MAG TPA: hypothetical protein DF383_04790 [Deltaproteobacteria bacterium]|nr:hypothetical protein [Deltaproteobacteria bacterium]
MRLRKEQIQKISEKILKGLEAQKLVHIKVPRETVLERIYKAMADDLSAEDRLDAEVKELVEKYRGTAANPQELFQKIKKQLAAERKMVL